MLLCRSCLLRRIVEYEIEEEVVSAQYTAHFAATLEVDEQFLVHKLKRSEQAVSVQGPRWVMRSLAPFSTPAAMPWTLWVCRTRRMGGYMWTVHEHTVGWQQVAIQTRGARSAESSAGRVHVEEHPLGHAWRV